MTNSDIRYLFKKWVENPTSESSQQQIQLALKARGLAPVLYEDKESDGEMMTHATVEGEDTVLKRGLPGSVLPGTMRMEVNNRLQNLGEDYLVNYMTGKVTWLGSAAFALDEEDTVFFKCHLLPITMNGEEGL